MEEKMTSVDDRVQGREYLTKYLNARVSRGSRKIATILPIEFSSMKVSERQPFGSIDPFDRQVYYEDSVDITMTESDFQRLLDALGYFSYKGNFDHYQKDLEMKVAFEKNMRETRPGVKKAYEKYRILLDMVTNGKDGT